MGRGVKTLAKIRELKTHLCYGLQRKKRTEESVKSTVLGGGGGNLEGNHEYWFTNQFIFKTT